MFKYLFQSKYDSLCFSLFLFEVGRILHDFFLHENGMAIYGSAIQLLAVIIFIFSFFRSPKKIVNSGITGVYFMFLFVSMLVIIRGIFDVQDGYDRLFINRLTLMPYILALAYTVTVTPSYIDSLVRWAKVFCVTGLLFMLYYFYDIFIDPSSLIYGMLEWDVYYIGRVTEGSYFWAPMAMLLWAVPHMKKYERFVFYIITIMAILGALLGGRRSAAFSSIIYILIFFLMKYYRSNPRIFRKILVLGIISVGLVQLYETPQFQEFLGKYFEVLAGRIDSDTRSWAEDEMINDFNKSPLDWIWGRGLMGTFHTDNSQLFNTSNRDSIETGYLYMILKGGILLLIPYVFILLRSFYLGWFKSENWFVKYCSLIILFRLIQLYPGGHLMFNFHGLIIWAMIAICNNKVWRYQDDFQIDNYIVKNE